MLKYEIIDNQAEEWVVFIHGLGGSTKTWKKQIDSFSQRYNLLLLDLPGHGCNAENTIHKVDTQKLHAGIRETMDHLGISRAHFVGLSLGTIVIADFAVRYPDYVGTIILGGSALKLSGGYKRALVLANRIKHLVPYEFLYKFFASFGRMRIVAVRVFGSNLAITVVSQDLGLLVDGNANLNKRYRL